MSTEEKTGAEVVGRFLVVIESPLRGSVRRNVAYAKAAMRDSINRGEVTTAKTFEDLGVAAYNGAAQYISSTDYLTLAGKIVSVEARHASSIRDLLNPKSGDFAPSTFDNVFKPALVASQAQGYVVDKLGFMNAPTSFIQGPNGNG